VNQSDKILHKANYHDVNHNISLTQVGRANHEMEYLQSNIHYRKRVFLNSETQHNSYQMIRIIITILMIHNDNNNNNNN
jgi:hypothetical protein